MTRDKRFMPDLARVEKLTRTDALTDFELVADDPAGDHPSARGKSAPGAGNDAQSHTVRLRAHKLVLWLRCRALPHDFLKTSSVRLRGVPWRAVSIFLEFVYSGLMPCVIAAAVAALRCVCASHSRRVSARQA